MSDQDLDAEIEEIIEKYNPNHCDPFGRKRKVYELALRIKKLLMQLQMIKEMVAGWE
jgi:hypothetical protein